MNCTLCQSLMFSNSEIHSALVNERKVSRIDLHCNNNYCQSLKLKYASHVQVIADDPNPWINSAYHLPFLHKGEYIAMVGEIKVPIIYWSGVSYAASKNVKDKYRLNIPIQKSQLVNLNTNEIIFESDRFYPLDMMNPEPLKILNKLLIYNKLS